MASGTNHLLADTLLTPCSLQLTAQTNTRHLSFTRALLFVSLPSVFHLAPLCLLIASWDPRARTRPAPQSPMQEGLQVMPSHWRTRFCPMELHGAT